MRLAIVGATGLVGSEILTVIKERKVFYSKLFLVASKKSKGKQIYFMGENYQIIGLEQLLKEDVDIALFSAGSKISKMWSPRLAKRGVKVIDNSSYWRMKPEIKLIVPEINGKQILKEDMIIANPNCSTIQLLMPLAPLHKKFKAKKIIISTYQSVTGTGQKAVEQLKSEEKGTFIEKTYPHQIYRNALPHCDDFLDNGYTKEEVKLSNETKKILDHSINVSATAVRIPVTGGHSESVHIKFSQDFSIQEVYEVLKKTDGVIIKDKILNNRYPMPVDVRGKDDVYVGRIRKDLSCNKSLSMWIVADNLRKGAATNTVQIAEHIIKNNLLKTTN